jgi:hypothetical protein
MPIYFSLESYRKPFSTSLGSDMQVVIGYENEDFVLSYLTDERTLIVLYSILDIFESKPFEHQIDGSLVSRHCKRSTRSTYFLMFDTVGEITNVQIWLR